MSLAFKHQLVCAESGELLLPQLFVADTFFTRLRGLQFRKPLAEGQGYWLQPCTSIHTHWMRFSIDVTFVDASMRVLAVYPDVRPWRFLTGPKASFATLETPCGAISRLELGRRLQIEIMSR